MKVLILGVTGTLGHKVYRVFDESKIDTYGTMRKNFSEFKEYNIFNPKKVFDQVDVCKYKRLGEYISEIKPDCVINCIGIMKTLIDNPVNTIYINSLFPHRLAKTCSSIDAKLIQISTNGVFSGRRGDYMEEDIPDPIDFYGRSKLLGEVTYDNHLTIRTSIIGRELRTKKNLVEWFLSQKGEINGYTNAIFTGFTTKTLSKILLEFVKKPKLKGLIHVSGNKISKYDLLCLMKDIFNKNIEIRKYGDFHCDSSLKAEKFKKLGIKIPSMKEMIKEMYEEDSFYEK